MESEKGNQSRYLTEYRSFMGADGDDRQIEVPSEGKLKKYCAQRIPSSDISKFQRPFSVRLTYVGQEASTAAYVVDIGVYRFTINVLNLPGKVNIDQGNLGKGGFGTVLSKQVANTYFAAKIIELNEKKAEKKEEKEDEQNKKKKKEPAIPEELSDALCEVTISKLCAMHQIGPDVHTTIPYDLILYDDAIQFHLERCEPIYYDFDRTFSTQFYKHHPNKFKDDLIECLRVLHSLHIAHKDIKPSNVLYCRRLGKFVLCDFGIAVYVKENIGYVSETTYAGTRGFLGPEMQRLMISKEKTGKVDLYYNDVYAFTVLLGMIMFSKPSANENCDEPKKGTNLNPKHNPNVDLEVKIYGDEDISQERCSDRRRSVTKTVLVSNNGSDTSKQTGDTSASTHLTLLSTSEVEEEKPESVFEQLDCYEFYTVVYAATTLNEHEFNLKDNLPKLTPQQKSFVYRILVKCLNRVKMDRVIQELQQIQPEEGTLERKWVEDFRRAYRNNFDQHKPLFAMVHSVGKEWIGNLIRLLGRRKALLVIQGQLNRVNQQASEGTADESMKNVLKGLEFWQGFPEYSESELQKQTHEMLWGVLQVLKKEPQGQLEHRVSETFLNALEQLGKIIDQLNGVNSRPTGGEAYETVLEEIENTRFRRLLNCRDRIIEKLGGASKEDVGTACYKIVFGMLSYDAKEFLLFDILACLQQPTLPTHQPYLQCLTALIRKGRQATTMLHSLVANLELLERCVMLASLHFQLLQEPEQLVDICSQLLERLAKRPPESCFLETVNMRRIIFDGERSKMKLSDKQVRLHFQECVQLLYRHSSHQDALSILIILQNRLANFHNFRFPAEDISTAHVEFEQHRQFYSGILIREANIQVMQSYRVGKLPAPENISKLDSELLRLEKHQQELYTQGLYQQCLEVQARMEQLKIEKHQQIKEAGKYEAALSSVLFKVHLLDRIGRSHDAQKLLSSIEQRVHSSSSLQYHREYYKRQAEVFRSFSKYSQAYESCEKAITFNNKLGVGSNRKHNAQLLMSMWADICFRLGWKDKGIRILQEQRNTLQANGQSPDYRNLASNYRTTADALRAMGRLDESSDFCAKMFELEQQGHIPPHESAFAHGVMMTIAMKRQQPFEQLRQSWLFIEKTDELGGTSFCVAYTIILRNLFPTVGKEVLSFASYTRRLTGPPEQRFRGNRIAEGLYLNPVPTGLLPLDIPVAEFIKLAETRLTTLPKEQHQPCFLFKTQLLVVMASQSTRHPHFKLLYVRTLVEAYLHELMAGCTQEVINKLPSILVHTKQREVEKVDQKDKHMLIEFAQKILVREQGRSLDEQLIQKLSNIPMILLEPETRPREILSKSFLSAAP